MAEQLTPAQRRALAQGVPDDTHPDTVAALERRGLVRDRQLTDTGHTVNQALTRD